MRSGRAPPRRAQEGFLIINDPLKPQRDNLIHTNPPLSLISHRTTLLPGSNYCLAPSAHHSLSRSNLYSFFRPAAQFSPHYTHLVSTRSIIDRASVKAFNSVYSYDPIRRALVYKPVAKKVRTIQTAMPPEFRIMRQLPDDPLAGMPTLPTHPPDFVPGVRFTQERADNLDLDPTNWLWPDELKLICWLVRFMKRHSHGTRPSAAVSMKHSFCPTKSLPSPTLPGLNATSQSRLQP
jgi:hypothetical protein